MGLFDNLFDAYAANRALGRAEAFAGILVAASACDGHVAKEEKQSLFTIVRRMKLFAGLADDRLEDLTGELLKVLNREGMADFLNRCAAALPQELRDTAFAN